MSRAWGCVSVQGDGLCLGAAWENSLFPVPAALPPTALGPQQWMRGPCLWGSPSQRDEALTADGSRHHGLIHTSRSPYVR